MGRGWWAHGAERAGAPQPSRAAARAVLHHYQGQHPCRCCCRRCFQVKFVGEEGVDEGGLQKEFFQLLVRMECGVWCGVLGAAALVPLACTSAQCMAAVAAGKRVVPVRSW